MPYHHGDLRNALIKSSVDLARAGGPTAVTIRAAARSVGVTPTAAYRHFADHESLLNETKWRAFDRMAAVMNEEMTTGPSTSDRTFDALATLAAVGRGYVKFALTEPGLFRTVFTQNTEQAPFYERGDDNPLFKMAQALDILVDTGYLPASRRPMAELAAWSAVHGYAMLLIDGPLQPFPAEARDVIYQRCLEIFIAGLGGPPLSDDLRAAIRADN